MIRLGKESKLSSGEIIDNAVKYFGPGGVGLEIRQQSQASAIFVGSGGYVTVQVDDREQGHQEVEIVSREWDHQAEKFLERI